MEALNKRGTALVLCLLMIVFSALVGARLSLMQLRGEAEQVFRDGVDGSGQGIAYDLAQILDESHNVSVIAGRNLSADNATLQDMLEKRGAGAGQQPLDAWGAAGNAGDDRTGRGAARALQEQH